MFVSYKWLSTFYLCSWLSLRILLYKMKMKRSTLSRSKFKHNVNGVDGMRWWVPEWALSWNKDIKHLCVCYSTLDSIDGSEIARKTIDVSADDDDSSSDTGFAEKQYIVVCFKGVRGDVMTHVYTHRQFLLWRTTNNTMYQIVWCENVNAE